MSAKRNVTGYLCIISASVLFGLMPLAADFVYADGVTPLTLVFLRNLFALPFLALFAKAGGADFKVPFRAAAKMAAIGTLGCLATPLLLYSSYQYINGGTATVLHHVYPAVVVAGGIVFLKKKTHTKQILCLSLCLAGVLFMYEPGGALDLRGALFALASGVTYGSYILLLASFPDKNISGFLFNFFSSSAISVLLGIYFLVSGNISSPHSFAGWAMCVVFSFAISVGAVILFQKGTYLIGGSRAAILGNVETVTGVLAGALFLQEKLTFNSIASMVLITAAGVLIAVFDARKHKVGN